MIETISAGDWTGKGLPLLGLELGVADISPLNEAVPEEVRAQIEATRQSMIDGTFNPYTGPIKKQNGETVLAEGAVIDDGGLWGMDYFVEGIIGTMPE